MKTGGLKVWRHLGGAFASALLILVGACGGGSAPVPADAQGGSEPAMGADAVGGGEGVVVVEEGQDTEGDSADPGDGSADAGAEAGAAEAGAAEAGAAEAGASEGAEGGAAAEGAEAGGSAPPAEGVPAADFGDRLNDPRFPDTLDAGPDSWPAWTPNYRIDSLTLPQEDGAVTTWTTSDPRNVIKGQAFQDGKKLEVRFELFEAGTRIHFERVECSWKEKGAELRLGCKPTDGDEVVEAVFEMVREGGTVRAKLDRASAEKAKHAPRALTMTKI